MKNGGLFSRTLYREGMRQTRALGFVFLGIVLGSLLMMFVMQVGAALTTPATARMPSFIDLYEGAPMLLLAFVWAPIMILILFHFVCKRNQCDFYHALPHTRQQLAGSFLAAILTWTLGGMLVAFGLYALLYSIVPNSIVIVNWTGSLHSLASSVSMLVLVTGGTFLAVSLTGTVSSGILATGLILLMPRILLGIITVRGVSTIPVVSVSDLPLPLGSYNLVANFFSDFFRTFHAPIGAIVYTFLLGVLYLVLGLWAFTQRRSERAGSAAISRGAQAIFRVLAASPILLGAAIVLTGAFSANPEMTGELRAALVFGAISSAVTLLAISLGVFILYELFTTRSGRRLLKILPTYGFVVLIAAAGLLTSLSVKSIVVAGVPKTEQVKSVSRLPYTINAGFLSDMFGYSPTYFDAVTKDIAIDDPTICAIAANALRNDVNTYTGNTGEIPMGSTTRLRFRLAGGGQMIRSVSLSSEQVGMIQEALLKNEDYIRVMTQLPDGIKTPVVIYDSNGALTVEQARQVYASLRQEIAEHDPKVWIERVTDANTWANLQMQAVVGSDVYDAFLPITPDYPKTLEMYLNFARQNVDLEKWLARNPLTPSDTGDNWSDIQINSFDGTIDLYLSDSDLTGEDGHLDPEAAQAWNETVEWIRAQAKKPIDVSKPYGRVTISAWKAYGGYANISFFIPMDDPPKALETLNRFNSFGEPDVFDETSSQEDAESSQEAPFNPGALEPSVTPLSVR